MIYKRGIVNIDKVKNVEYVVSSNKGVYLNTSVIGENFAPYHGLFITQNGAKTEVLLSRMIEKIDVGTKIYEIKDYKTSEKKYGGCEYLSEFTNEFVPTYIYDTEEFKLEKKYKFVSGINVLCIEYRITNKQAKALKFTAIPLVTNRELFVTKRASDINFNTVHVSNMVKINLSISESKDLYIRGAGLKFESDKRVERGVNYDFEEEPKVIKTFVEDLFVPGNFDAVVRGGNTNTFCIYVALHNIDSEKFSPAEIEFDVTEKTKDILQGIDKNFHELRDLARTAYLLSYIDDQHKKLFLLESIPQIKENDRYVKNIIASIEGNYLLLKRFKEAKIILEAMMLKLKDEKYSLNAFDRCEAELLFIEAVNRYLQETECASTELKSFYLYIKDVIYKYIEKRNTDAYMDEDSLLMVEGKKYIKINAMWFNALKIYTFLTDKFLENSDYAYKISENIKNSIVDKFWCENEGVLRYEVSERPYVNIDMIYVLSLSFPILHDKIALKIMDSSFRKLYSPLGMRLAEVASPLYDGYVYPHLMVQFLKANLRQMGVTRATQKIAYNMVKELFAEINKNVLGTVKYRYYEDDKKAYGNSINALTNAELIRMFDMLT